MKFNIKAKLRPRQKALWETRRCVTEQPATFEEMVDILSDMFARSHRKLEVYKIMFKDADGDWCILDHNNESLRLAVAHARKSERDIVNNLPLLQLKVDCTCSSPKAAKAAKHLKQSSFVAPTMAPIDPFTGEAEEFPTRFLGKGKHTEPEVPFGGAKIGARVSSRGSRKSPATFTVRIAEESCGTACAPVEAAPCNCMGTCQCRRPSVGALARGILTADDLPEWMKLCNALAECKKLRRYIVLRYSGLAHPHELDACIEEMEEKMPTTLDFLQNKVGTSVELAKMLVVYSSGFACAWYQTGQDDEDEWQEAFGARMPLWI